MEEEDFVVKTGTASLAAPLIFLVTIFLQIITIFLQRLKKRRSSSTKQNQLRAQIKELVKEAESLSNPSTFAQAAKLRRMAAAKEKELLKSQEMHSKEYKLSYDAYFKALTVLKVVTHLMLVVWFWGDPVAAVSKQLLQPFGKVLSWRARDLDNDHIMVGIIPWLIVSNRVSKLICQKLSK